MLQDDSCDHSQLNTTRALSMTANITIYFIFFCKSTDSKFFCIKFLLTFKRGKNSNNMTTFKISATRRDFFEKQYWLARKNVGKIHAPFFVHFLNFRLLFLYYKNSKNLTPQVLYRNSGVKWKDTGLFSRYVLVISTIF
jgi:hypothetical protein